MKIYSKLLLGDTMKIYKNKPDPKDTLTTKQYVEQFLKEKYPKYPYPPALKHKIQKE